MTSRTFMTFLKQRMNTPEVSDILIPGIIDDGFPADSDESNLFSVTPHFLKTCEGEPQKVLEALLVSYNRWIVGNLSAMRDSIERCTTANKVIFLENSEERGPQMANWRGVNECMENLSGGLEDLIVQSNYLLKQRVAPVDGN